MYSCITPAAQMSRKRYYVSAAAKLVLLLLLFGINDFVTSCAVWR